MNLNALKDCELLTKVKTLCLNERHVLTQILEHLREVERRRLYSDLGYSSLFDYCVNELGYSEGGAGRRIQAMRLIKEIPEVRSKIEEGKINLSNLSQAQSYFRGSAKCEPLIAIHSTDKLKIIESLENKSAREGQKILLSLNPERPLPRERERVISPVHTEVSFILSVDLKEKLEELRSLLGTKGSSMSLAQLIDQMADWSLIQAKAIRFGKRRTQKSETNVKASLGSIKGQGRKTPSLLPMIQATEADKIISPRSVPRELRFQVWQRDQGRCTCCGTQRNINFDHIQPIGLGGLSTPENLRLLCFHCNQRAAIRGYGLDKMVRHQEQLRLSELG